MTEKDIQKALWFLWSSHKYRFLNTYYFRNESDYLSWTTTGYTYDAEIKITKSDYKADFHKPRHQMIKDALLGGLHTCIKQYTEKVNWQTLIHVNPRTGQIWKGSEIGNKSSIYFESIRIPNRFYFAVPEGLISLEEVPEYAGLIYIEEYLPKYSNALKQYRAKIIKKAPLLHKEKHDVTKQFNLVYNKYESEIRNRLWKQ